MKTARLPSRGHWPWCRQRLLPTFPGTLHVRPQSRTRDRRTRDRPVRSALTLRTHDNSLRKSPSLGCQAALVLLAEVPCSLGCGDTPDTSPAAALCEMRCSHPAVQLTTCTISQRFQSSITTDFSSTPGTHVHGKYVDGAIQL